MLWRLIKTAIFTVLAPGTVGVYVPQVLRRGSGDHAAPSLFADAWLALFFCGAGIYLWCAYDFAVKGLGTPAPIDRPRVLVVKGLYRFTRNPMYIGVAAMLAVLLGFHVFVRLYEELTLRRLFGAQYEGYCRAVPRWLPRLPHE